MTLAVNVSASPGMNVVLSVPVTMEITGLLKMANGRCWTVSATHVFGPVTQLPD